MARRRNQARSAAHLARAVRGASAPGSPSLGQRLAALPRMIRAVRAGEYTGMSNTRLLTLLLGLGYVISPVDVVPEGLLLVVGLVDDAVVLSWLAVALVQETEQFIAWEQGVRGGVGQPIPGEVVPD
ncbi:hypothetical protein GCM10022199_23190 [Marihabitans asiaticum]|uniref:Uncharacterized protein DUF1232 n=1 Tax=Marihabitans asiaticum TaxID=415218 RepID=A0A560WA01_9MICO|nr:YkvA family protein [Marihabitans asiaticum]TWD14459.1 uncharacterized protein DUF1232 [Marihabitans asiaticum]